MYKKMMKLMNQQKKYIRQGDVLLEKINRIDTKDLIQMGDSKTVAFGEKTGHNHRFGAQDQVLLFKEKETEQLPSIITVMEKATLTHQEHLPVIVPEGTYKVIGEKDYNPFTKKLVRAMD